MATMPVGLTGRFPLIVPPSAIVAVCRMIVGPAGIAQRGHGLPDHLHKGRRRAAADEIGAAGKIDRRDVVVAQSKRRIANLRLASNQCHRRHVLRAIDKELHCSRRNARTGGHRGHGRRERHVLTDGWIDIRSDCGGRAGGGDVNCHVCRCHRVIGDIGRRERDGHVLTAAGV